MEKKIVTSKAKVPEVGCVIVKIHSQEKLDKIQQNVRTSLRMKRKALQRKKRAEWRKKEQKEKAPKTVGELILKSLKK